MDPLKEIGSTRGAELSGKKVILCVTGSVAAVESPSIAREMIRHGAEVFAVMSEASKRLLRPDLLEWATGNPVVTSLTGKTEHVRLVRESDLVLVAPCTANTISKLALGIDDTTVTTVCSMAVGSRVPVILCPAAHEPMYSNPAVVRNLARLKEEGVEVVEPRMEEGKAKIADGQTVLATVVRRLSTKDLAGAGVLVTGGPTVEFIDPVRVITNLSSGKMGLYLALQAWSKGARTKYLYGGGLAPPPFLESERFLTTEDMLNLVLKELKTGAYDVFIAAAAPADFAPVRPWPTKVSSRKGELTLRLAATPKIVEAVRNRWGGLIVAFKAETVESKKDLTRRARAFLRGTGVDMVAANPVSRTKGFASDRNEIILVTKERSVDLGKDLKERLAGRLLDEVSKELSRREIGKSWPEAGRKKGSRSSSFAISSPTIQGPCRLRRRTWS